LGFGVGGLGFGVWSRGVGVWGLGSGVAGVAGKVCTSWGIRGWKSYAPAMGYHEPQNG
jgi:hypothetical protein